MSLTLATIQTELNSYLGDSSTNTVTAAQRLSAMTEATIWLQETLENDLQNATYSLDYWDSVYNYKITTSIADLLTGADLRRETEFQDISFAHKSSRELAEEIGQTATESSWTIERRDTNTYLVINHQSRFNAKNVSDFDALTAGGGTWSLDATNGDGTNLTIDTVEKKQGSASFNFDTDGGANDKIIIVNTTLNTLDLSEFEDLATWLFWVYIPDVTNFTSVTLYWGSDTSNYWSATVTKDIDGSNWVNGWNRVKINWADATKTLAPDKTLINYIQIDYTYSAAQAADTDYRLDDLILVRPERLIFHYLSWNVGVDTNGTDITVFGATTDVPYFSGMYDQYLFAVAHKSAAILYRQMRQSNESELEERESERAVKRARKIIPSSKTPEVKSFKVMGISFLKRRGR